MADFPKGSPNSPGSGAETALKRENPRFSREVAARTE